MNTTFSTLQTLFNLQQQSELVITKYLIAKNWTKELWLKVRLDFAEVWLVVDLATMCGKRMATFLHCLNIHSHSLGWQN